MQIAFAEDMGSAQPSVCKSSESCSVLHFSIFFSIFSIAAALAARGLRLIRSDSTSSMVTGKASDGGDGECVSDLIRFFFFSVSGKRTEF